MMAVSLRVTYRNAVQKELSNLVIPLMVTLFIIFALIFINWEVNETRASAPAGAGDAGSGPAGMEVSAAGETDWGPIEQYKPLIKMYAERYGVEPELVRALVMHESGGDVDLVSSRGALGLMQCMPDKFAPGEDPFNPETNIKKGTRYLARMMDKFGTVRLSVAAYNAGPGAVEKYGGVPPYAETRAFVPRVVKSYINYRQAD